jgi:hypothetical protein
MAFHDGSLSTAASKLAGNTVYVAGMLVAECTLFVLASSLAWTCHHHVPMQQLSTPLCILLQVALQVWRCNLLLMKKTSLMVKLDG